MTVATNTMNPTTEKCCDPKNHLMQTVEGGEPQMIPDPLCPVCSKYVLHPDASDPKNHTPSPVAEWEKEEQKLMDILHEFNRENLEEPFDGQPLMRRARKWNYARQIIEIFQHIAKEEYERGRKDAVEFIKKPSLLVEDLMEYEGNLYMKIKSNDFKFEMAYIVPAETLEAALETSS